MSSTLTDTPATTPTAPEAIAPEQVASRVPLQARLWPVGASLSISEGLFLGCTALFFGAVFLLLLSANMHKAIDHDEHMYVSAGVLLARQGLLPYRDFPYLQMPNLVFVYAVLFKLPGDPFLLARLFSTACATLGMAVMYSLVSVAVGGRYIARFFFGVGSVLLLLANPIFAYTSGEAWNHDLPVLFSLLALGSVLVAVRREKQGRWLLLCGLMGGLALGTRLSFAPLLLVLLVATLLLPSLPLRKRASGALLFCLGAALACLPVVVLFALAPAQFIFGNVQYHATNALYWQAVGYTRAMDLPGKLDYLKDVLLQPANEVLAVSLLVLVVAAVVYRKSAGKTAWLGMLIPAGVVPFLLLGTLVPTPSWYQYFYAPLPFVVLGIAFAAAALYSRTHWAALPFAMAVGASCLLGQLPVPSMDTSTWVPLQAHATGQQIASYVGSAPVLTLAPIYPLEGGAHIYSQFVNGPFLLRSDTLFSPEQRQASGVPSATALLQSFAAQPPLAILTGYEPGLEAAWVDYATTHHYRPISLVGGKTLWLAPAGNNK